MYTYMCVRFCTAYVLMLQTCVGTSENTGSHADVAIPGRRMKPNVTSDKRLAQEMVTLEVFVYVSTEILSKIRTFNNRNSKSRL